MLSRGIAGVSGSTLIVNLPGSTGGVRDGMAVLGPVLAHAVSQINGGDHPRPPAHQHPDGGDPHPHPGRAPDLHPGGAPQAHPGTDGGGDADAE
jgi:hypothetical protein